MPFSESYSEPGKTIDKRDRNVTSERLGEANGGSVRANADSRMCAFRWKLCVARSPLRSRLLALITQRSLVHDHPRYQTTRGPCPLAAGGHAANGEAEIEAHYCTSPVGATISNRTLVTRASAGSPRFSCPDPLGDDGRQTARKIPQTTLTIAIPWARILWPRIPLRDFSFSASPQFNDRLAHLESVRRTRRGFIARCPSHPDR